jgi:hypothetical protein
MRSTLHEVYNAPIAAIESTFVTILAAFKDGELLQLAAEVDTLTPEGVSGSVYSLFIIAVHVYSRGTPWHSTRKFTNCGARS